MDEEYEEYDNYLVPSWNRGKPKFMRFLYTILHPLNALLDILYSYYVTAQIGTMNVETAEGKQLDMIGALVGCTRVLPVAFSGLSRTLDDDEDYRLLIKAKIAGNNWDGTLQGFESIFSTLFKNFNAQIIDNQDCTVEVKLTSSTNITPVQTQMLLGGLLLPSAAGVMVTVNIQSEFVAAKVGLKTGVYSIGMNTFGNMSM